MARDFLKPIILASAAPYNARRIAFEEISETPRG